MQFSKHILFFLIFTLAAAFSKIPSATSLTFVFPTTQTSRVDFSNQRQYNSVQLPGSVLKSTEVCLFGYYISTTGIKNFESQAHLVCNVTILRQMLITFLLRNTGT